MLSMPSSSKRDRNEMGHQRLLEHLHSGNEEFREVLPHPNLLYLGRHTEAVGNTTTTPPFSKLALSYLCKTWTNMAKRMKDMEAQPSTNFVQLIHLSRFGQQQPWRPCGKILLLFICALTLALEVFRGRSIAMSDLQPREEGSSFKATSSGFDGAYIDQLSNFLASDRLMLGTFGTERHRGRSHRMNKTVHNKLSALASVAYERMMVYGLLPPLTFALSTGRSAVRELYTAGKFGGRLVWNLSKLSMYTLFGGANMWKEAMKFGPGSPFLIGYGPGRGRAGQLGDRLRKYDLFIALDLPRCDAQFQTFLTVMILMAAALITYQGDPAEVWPFYNYIFRSATFVPVSLVNGAVYLKLMGLASGHLFVTLLESVGSVVFAYVIILYLMWHHLSIHPIRAVLNGSISSMGEVVALGDDLLICLTHRGAAALGHGLAGSPVSHTPGIWIEMWTPDLEDGIKGRVRHLFKNC